MYYLAKTGGKNELIKISKIFFKKKDEKQAIIT
jgi:hypothetical protein